MLKFALPLFALALGGCDSRAPESALFGTWHNITPTLDQATYYRFNSNHTFNVSFGGIDELISSNGKWYAGGPNIYLRFTRPTPQGQRPLVLHIVEIGPDVIRVRWSEKGVPVVLSRVKEPATKTSN